MGLEICLRRFTESEILGPGEMKSIKTDIISALKNQLGSEPEWHEGESVEGETLPLGGLEALIQLQRYSAHLDLAGIPPELPATERDLDEDRYLLEYWEAAENESQSLRLGFKHLIWTGNVGIFYIPIEFSEPLLIEMEDMKDEDHDEANDYVSVGSSNRLLHELDKLRVWLSLHGDYSELGERVSREVFENKQDPWNEVKWAWLVLHWMARLSIEKRLSLCFE